MPMGLAQSEDTIVRLDALERLLVRISAQMEARAPRVITEKLHRIRS